MTIWSEELVSAVRNNGFNVGEMNNDQLEYFLVDKNTRNVMQIEYPSDLDAFNKILGTSEGKNNLLQDLGLIISSNNN